MNVQKTKCSVTQQQVRATPKNQTHTHCSCYVLAFYKSWTADVWSSVGVPTFGGDVALRWSRFPQHSGNECFGDADAVGGAQRAKRG